MKALIVVDMQNDFITGSLGTTEAEAIIPAVQRKISEFLANGDAVFFTRDTHEPDYLSTQEGKHLPVVHCVRDTWGWQLEPSLDTHCCRIIDKPTFGSVELAAQLSVLDNLTSIELCGLCTDICVISNALILKAYLHEVPIAVDAACCAGVTPESHENALKAMRMCQVEII